MNSRITSPNVALTISVIQKKKKKNSSEPTSGNIQEEKEGRQFKASVHSIQMYLDAGILSLCPLQQEENHR